MNSCIKLAEKVLILIKYIRYKDFLVILSNSSDSSNKLALFSKNLLQDLDL